MFQFIFRSGSTETRTVATSKEQIETTRQMGMTSEYPEVEGGTHMSMIAPDVPRILEFFAAIDASGAEPGACWFSQAEPHRLTRQQCFALQ